MRVCVRVYLYVCVSVSVSLCRSGEQLGTYLFALAQARAVTQADLHDLLSLPHHSAVQVAQLTYYSTFALNFFLYTMYGRHFQQALGDLASRGRHVVKDCCCSSSGHAHSDSSSGRDVPVVYRAVHRTSRTIPLRAASSPVCVPQHPAPPNNGVGATRV